MAAPSGTTWGAIAGGYGRIGICFEISDTETHRTVTISTWFWSKYSISDTNNNYYYSANATSATGLVGSISLKTSVNSGSGWSTSNQVKLGQSTYKYARETKAKTISYAIKLTGVDRVGATMTHTRSVTIPALASYTVSYNANGGSGAPDSQTKYYGVGLTISSTIPTRSGYTFMGWSLNEVSESVYYTAGSTCGRNENITLYAVWKKTIELTYNGNGGSGAPAKQSATVYNATTNHKFTLPTTKPTRTGYTFLGWSTSASATSATYSAGGSITLSSSDTIYAVWKINSYKLTVKPEGGTWDGSTADQTFTQNYKTTKSIPAPTWVGHTFAGWLLSGGGSLADGTYTFGTSDGTLTARWDTNDYVVYFDVTANGGNTSGFTPTKTVEYGTAIGKLPTATKKNYTFLGWFTAPTGGTKIDSSYVVTGDVTFYAQFEIDATAYVNAEDVWEEGVVYTTVNGKPKKGHAKVNVNGVWEDGICK